MIFSQDNIYYITYRDSITEAKTELLNKFKNVIFINANTYTATRSGKDCTVYLVDYRDPVLYPLIINSSNNSYSLNENEKSYFIFVVNFFLNYWRSGIKNIFERTESDRDLLILNYKIEKGIQNYSSYDFELVSFLIDTIFLMWNTPELFNEKTLDEKNLTYLRINLSSRAVKEANSSTDWMSNLEPLAREIVNNKIQKEKAVKNNKKKKRYKLV